jgi:hypothetical protein
MIGNSDDFIGGGTIGKLGSCQSGLKNQNGNEFLNREWLERNAIGQ